MVMAEKSLRGSCDGDGAIGGEHFGPGQRGLCDAVGADVMHKRAPEMRRELVLVRELHAGFWRVDGEAAMGRFEVAWLPAFGIWTEAVHGVVVAGFRITGAACAVALAVQVYRFALTGLACVLGKGGWWFGVQRGFSWRVFSADSSQWSFFCSAGWWDRDARDPDGHGLWVGVRRRELSLVGDRRVFDPG